MVVGAEFAYSESASQAVYRRRDRGSKGQIQARLELKKRDQSDQQKQYNQRCVLYAYFMQNPFLGRVKFEQPLLF